MTFFKKVEAEFEKLFSKAPTWEATAATTLKFVAPVVETLLTFTDPAAEAVVAPLITEIQTDMATASVVIASAGPTPTLQSALTSITTNISAIESAVKITDPATQASFTAATTALTAEITAISAAIPSTTK